MRGVVWFKKDLRIHDNPALYHACQHCDGGVVAVYIVDHDMWHRHGIGPRQIEFIYQRLISLREDLAQIDIPLLIISTKKTSLIPNIFIDLASQLKTDDLFFNRELELNENKRDTQVTTLASQYSLKVHCYDDQLILPYQQFFAFRKTYFKIFSPFKRHWIKNFDLHQNTQLLTKPKSKKRLNVSSRSISFSNKEVLFFTPTPFLSEIKQWPAEEKSARHRLKSFIRNKLAHYHKERDYPFLDATSRLSPYLAIGILSARECFISALRENNLKLDSGNKGALTWMSELIWRDFYRHILIAVPRVCMNQAYQLATEDLPWSYNKKLFQAWQQGETGFPIIDAAMRQLKQTGWMHNRLRMVVAMFLSKNLFLDWRLGEQYFAQQLIDFDFSSNNGGWQWSASTGTDAVPYFRIFNPTRQSERFDPQGDFIRQFCPALKDFDKRSIHNPYHFAPQQAQKNNYPRPIIDYTFSRERCLEAFCKLMK